MLVISLLLYVTWLVLGFAVRIGIQRKRTGDTGVQGFGGAPGTAIWWASLLLAVAHTGGIAGPIAGLFGLPPIAVLDTTPVRVAGFVLVLGGIAASVVAQLKMGDSWRIGVAQRDETALVTSGPFAVVRNPIFSAVAVTAAGFVLVVGNVVSLALFVALVGALQLQVRLIEEPYLAHTHGRHYRQYAAAVGRFVPGLGRLPQP